MAWLNGWHWEIYPAIVYLLTLFLIRWVLLTPNRVPVSTVAWVVAIIFLPFVGGLLFLVFGINRVERRARRKQEASRTIASHSVDLLQHQMLADETLTPLQTRMMRLARRASDAAPTFGNEVEVLEDTNRTLGLIRQAILSAKHSLHLEYYIWQPDRTGTNLRDLLIQKAREGVKIRFLFDSLGSLWLNQRFLKPMIRAGIQVAAFLPGQSLRERWSINLRNHRKIVIVDGEIGFTGGMNIGDEYIGRNPVLGYWRDTHLRLRGPAVLQLQQIFAEDWFYATGEQLTGPEFFPSPEARGPTIAQVIAGEPATETHAFMAVFFAAINEATDRVLLSTSYFVPPDPLVTALETAALRGVRVRLLVAGKAAHFGTVQAGRSYYDALLRVGVEIHEYTGGLLHSKVLTIDGEWSMIGSPNLDSRSLLLNFEVGVALFDPRIALQLEEQFEANLAYARRVDRETWADRPSREVLVENFCRLFAPVL